MFLMPLYSSLVLSGEVLDLQPLRDEPKSIVLDLLLPSSCIEEIGLKLPQSQSDPAQSPNPGVVKQYLRRRAFAWDCQSPAVGSEPPIPEVSLSSFSTQPSCCRLDRHVGGLWHLHYSYGITTRAGLSVTRALGCPLSLRFWVLLRIYLVLLERSPQNPVRRLRVPPPGTFLTTDTFALLHREWDDGHSDMNA